MITNLVGQRLRTMLHERGWTQKVLADVVGKHETWVSQLTNGRRPLTAEAAARLSAAFGEFSTEDWLSLFYQDQLDRLLRDHLFLRELEEIRMRGGEQA